MRIAPVNYLLAQAKVPPVDKGKGSHEFTPKVEDVIGDPDKTILPDLFENKQELPPIPEYKGGDLKDLLEYNELLKKRLRDAGQNVPDNPLGFPEEDNKDKDKVKEENKQENKIEEAPKPQKKKKRRRSRITALC